MRKNDYYAKEISFFVGGYLAGSAGLLIFLALNKFGYESAAWLFVGTVGGVGSILAGGSFVLRALKRLDAAYPEESKQPPWPHTEESAVTPVIEMADAERVNEPSENETISRDLGVTFPHYTKALEVAQAASLEFWSDYDPNRPPLQKQVTAFMVERGIPARQAQELAIAIKPDDLP